MKLNELDWNWVKDVPIMGENRSFGGDIYYEFPNGNVIKLGEFKFDPKYRHVRIEICNIAEIEYEPNNGCCPHNYWFRSQYVMDRYHGGYRDIKWVIDNFKSVTPYQEEINNLLITFIEQAIDIAECGQLGKEAVI